MDKRHVRLVARLDQARASLRDSATRSRKSAERLAAAACLLAKASTGSRGGVGA